MKEQEHIDLLIDDVTLAGHHQVIGFRLIHLYFDKSHQRPQTKADGSLETVLSLTPAGVSDLCCVSPTRAAETLAVLSNRGHITEVGTDLYKLGINS